MAFEYLDIYDEIDELVGKFKMPKINFIDKDTNSEINKLVPVVAVNGPCTRKLILDNKLIGNDIILRYDPKIIGSDDEDAQLIHRLIIDKDVFAKYSFTDEVSKKHYNTVGVLIIKLPYAKNCIYALIDIDKDNKMTCDRIVAKFEENDSKEMCDRYIPTHITRAFANISVFHYKLAS
jgi:hypothetical protein